MEIKCCATREYMSKIKITQKKNEKKRNAFNLDIVFRKTKTVKNSTKKESRMHVDFSLNAQTHTHTHAQQITSSNLNFTLIKQPTPPPPEICFPSCVFYSNGSQNVHR